MEILIITGLSGSGKTRAADVCEDLNYYCVDNLPAALLPQFAALCGTVGGRLERAALVMDVRSLADHEALADVLDELSRLDGTIRILYLEAATDAILRRYKERRRRHPLAASAGDTRRALEREAALLAPMRERADLVIDTTGMSLNALGARIRSLLEPGRRFFSVSVMSFGYKNGLPPEADIVFDVRCLPNPYYMDALRDLTGLDAPVRDYIFGHDAAVQLRSRLDELVTFLVPLFEQDRAELTVAIGCTGGRHRSVAMAQALADALESRDISVSVLHRELAR